MTLRSSVTMRARACWRVSTAFRSETAACVTRYLTRDRAKRRGPAHDASPERAASLARARRAAQEPGTRARETATSAAQPARQRLPHPAREVAPRRVRDPQFVEHAVEGVGGLAVPGLGMEVAAEA